MNIPHRNASFAALQAYCPSSILPLKRHLSQCVKCLFDDLFQIFHMQNFNQFAYFMQWLWIPLNYLGMLMWWGKLSNFELPFYWISLEIELILSSFYIAVSLISTASEIQISPRYTFITIKISLFIFKRPKMLIIMKKKSKEKEYCNLQ